MPTKVVHCKKEPYDIYIGRPSIYGNPFKIGKHGTREEVLEKYREYLLSNLYLLEKIKELDGKVLGCWCKPLSCHGDIMMEILNKIKKGEIKDGRAKDNNDCCQSAKVCGKGTG